MNLKHYSFSVQNNTWITIISHINYFLNLILNLYHFCFQIYFVFLCIQDYFDHSVSNTVLYFFVSMSILWFYIFYNTCLYHSVSKYILCFYMYSKLFFFTSLLSRLFCQTFTNWKGFYNINHIINQCRGKSISGNQFARFYRNCKKINRS